MNRAVERLPQLAEARSLIPETIWSLAACDLFIGADPVFAGFARYRVEATDGRSYRETAHCAYPWHAADKRTTIVIPKVREFPVDHLVHEIGHVLDWRLGFEWEAEAVTKYAEVNRQEAFAEAFTAWVVEGYLWWERGLSCDRDSRDLFERLRQS